MKNQFTELIHQVKIKTKKSQDSISQRNYLNESYQQHQFLNIKSSLQRLIENLEYLSKQGAINVKCFNKVGQFPLKYSSSILSLCKNTIQILKQEPKLKITHQHHSSQIIFLAFYLRYCFPDKYIRILTTKRSFKNWEKYIIESKSTDPQSDLKSLLNEVKIHVNFIKESYEQDLINKNEILIFDLMNSQVIEYKPLLLSLRQKLQLPQKVIIYNSHDQQLEVQSILASVKTAFFPSQISLTYPIQIQYNNKDADIKKNLTHFLKEDSNHPEKQDIIIFFKNQHLSNSTSKKFISKLKDSFSEQNLLGHVQFISSKSQLLIDGKNHIFITENVDQLLQWNYSYSQVFYIIDYGWNVCYKMDHQKFCWVESLNKCDLREKTRRISFVGINKVGKYIYKEDEYSESISYVERSKQIMTYVLRMINLDLTQFLQVQNSRVKGCIDNLIKQKIIKKAQHHKLQIIDQQAFKYNQKGIDPIQSKIIRVCLQKQKEKQNKILSNAVLMSLCILNTRGNLRQSKDSLDSKSVVKPTGIWRKTGYLDSCLQILTKAEIIENGKNVHRSISRRKTSKMNETQFQVYGSLFQVITPKKMQFQQMGMDDLVRQYFVNDTIFTEMRSKLDQMREIFDVQQTNINLDNKLLDEIIQCLTSALSNSIAFFSGSRRLGYLYKHQIQKKKSIFPNRQSLLSQLNETPQFLIVLRCAQQQGKQQILMCNHINLDSFMSICGQLPSKNSESLAEHEIEFHGISSSVFKALFRNNGIQMQRFEQEYKCFVEPNEQMATITIYCSKEVSQTVNKAFQQLINKIKQKFSKNNKVIHYLGNTNISMSNGGQIKQIIKDNYINSCYLNNLDLQVTNQDLEELFDQFFVLKNIDVLPPQINKFSKSAIIQFNSQKDYYRFFSYYNECKYFDRILQVKPIAMKKSFTVQAQMYIDFKWYVWKSHKKAIIIFKNVESAQKALEDLQKSPQFDGSPVKFSIQKNKIFLDDLNQSVDQIYLQKGFSRYGDIQQVQILKTPLKEPPNQQNLLDGLLRDTLEIPRNQDIADKYKIHQIQKHKNGLRKCKVVVKKVENLKKLIQKLNQVKGKIGTGRLYTQSMYTRPILVIYPSAIHLYRQLLEQTINQAPQKPNLKYNLKDFGNNRLYFILQSPLFDTLQFISNEFQNKLKPCGIELSELKKNIILSDVGINNLIDLQEKFNCKLVVNSMKKTLEVICKFKDLTTIKKQIEARVQDKFFYRISLNTKSYRNLSNDKQKLQSIKQKYFLTVLQIEEYSKTLIFEGSANHVQNSLNYMMHVIQSFSKAQQQMINSEVCLICYEELTRPYRLQNCGHKFCFGCLDQCINSTLGDITMFPIKCPHCMIQVTVDDLESLIDAGSWPKLINMAVNQYVNRNAQVMTFCYTPGCKQINMLKLKNFKCDVCAASFCIQCKQRWHQGLTCQQAKLGTDTLFKKYMQQNGVRVCPNKNCKMPIVRTDGCFRVTCSRCNKSMCFKCDPDKMIAYDDYNECYKHLNDVHGGYW